MRARLTNGLPGPRRPPKSPGDRTLGVEEEFHVVDLETRRAAPRAPELLRGLPTAAFTPELQSSVVETNTVPCTTLDDLRGELWRRRRQLIAAADKVGLGLLSAGTPPLAEPAELGITPSLRYDLMLQEYEQLAREQVICGCHVHVYVEDRDLAVAVAQHISIDLPVLLAASASSPFWCGTDTGYASYRTMVWARWPTSGPFPTVANAAEYTALVRDLIATEVITDSGMIYYDVRPSAHVPTLELRLCDASPRVDDVVLVAGLFRALTNRAIDDLAAGRKPSPHGTSYPKQELLRTAIWRAARSGLEGKLVDLRALRPVPAPELLMQLMSRLRPELEDAGDWPYVWSHAQELAASCSSAARQRHALNRADSMQDVVDLVLAETGGTEPLAGALPAPEDARPLADYLWSRGEAVARQGIPHVLSSGVLSILDGLGSRVLSRREEARNRHQLEHDVTFAVAGEPRPFPIDLVPRVVGTAEWRQLLRGVEQRALALELFLRDVYGRRSVVRDGVLPRWMIDTSAATRPGGALVPEETVRASVVGIDLVCDAAGKWRVLEDNLRIPSGLAYALQARRLLAAVMPELGPAEMPASIEAVPEMLLTALKAAAPVNARPDADVSVALLSVGATDSAWWEHRTLAERMGIPLVRSAELEVTTSGVFLLRAGKRTRIDVVYRRLEEDLLDHLPAADHQPLGRRLRGAVRDGVVTLANAPGNGIGDDKAVYSLVTDFIRYYLGEEPLLPDVPTYLCARPDDLSQVLDRLRELVVKPVDGFGGSGVLIGPAASRAELNTARREILAAPAQWIAQEVVQLCTHPTLAGGRIEERHVDLRVFATLQPDPGTGRAKAKALPAPLTRMAPAGSLVVNSSRGGGAKDTWIVG
ncbi:MAG: glutamate--cysteine ligase [Frankiaceae bacterium]